MWHKARPRGIVWGGRREGGSGWGTHIYLWRIHVDIWQNQYNIAKLKNKKRKKKEIRAKNIPNLGGDLYIDVQEFNRSLPKFQPETIFKRHIIIKLSKIKD